VSFHGARNIVTKVVREMSKLFGLFFLLFSLNVSAGTDIFTCKLDAKKSRGWIPTNLVISFLEDGKTAKINYGHKPDSIRVVKYGWKFKEANASISMKAQDGKRFETKHKITIFENNKVSYDFTAVGTSSHYSARGTCTAKLIKTNVPKQQTKTKANIPNQTSTNLCLTTPARCTDSQLCESATFSNYSGTKIWRGSSTAAIHVSEAKSRRLKCGTDGIVTENSSQKISVAMCSTNATACTPRQVCEMATYVTGSKRKWKTTSSSAQYVQQAKQLGLPCEVIRHEATAVMAKPKVQATNTASKSKLLYATQKLACADIGFVVGTTEFANCVLQLVTLQSGAALQKNRTPATAQRPSYSSATRICTSEGEAGASSTYKSITPDTSSYNSNCRSTGYNSVNCKTTGGVDHDGGFSNFANTVSRNQSSYRIFEACMLKYGYEPPKRNMLKKIFGIK
jgi:hypothetical protein